MLKFCEILDIYILEIVREITKIAVLEKMTLKIKSHLDYTENAQNIFDLTCFLMRIFEWCLFLNVAKESHLILSYFKKINFWTLYKVPDPLRNSRRWQPCI